MGVVPIKRPLYSLGRKKPVGYVEEFEYIEEEFCEYCGRILKEDTCEGCGAPRTRK